jgi:hypothetical protein
VDPVYVGGEAVFLSATVEGFSSRSSDAIARHAGDFVTIAGGHFNVLAIALRPNNFRAAALAPFLLA